MEYNLSTGIGAVSRNVLSHIPEHIAFAFDNLILAVLAQQRKVAVKYCNVISSVPVDRMIMKKRPKFIKPKF